MTMPDKLSSSDPVPQAQVSNTMIPSPHLGSASSEIDTGQSANKPGEPVDVRHSEGNAVESSISNPTNHPAQAPTASRSVDQGFDNLKAQETINLLWEMKKMLKAMSVSSVVAPVDQSTRARFWDLYKVEAEGFHADFLEKHNGDLDNSLIFTGLFCGVDATFLVLMQPNLGPDPNVTTQTLLMIIAHSLNSTVFPGQGLSLPQFDGPSRTTIWVQSLLYASLAASLFAALAAMLGKQWLTHFARVGLGTLTAEQHCVERHRKSVAMKTWHFHAVLTCIPLLLQVSLFLFVTGMAGYLWDQQRAVSTVLIAVGVLVILFYVFTVVSSLLYSDCPFRTPITEALILLSRRIATWRKHTVKALIILPLWIYYQMLTFGKYIKQQWDLFGSPPQIKGNGPNTELLPIWGTAQQALPVSYGKADDNPIMNIVTKGPHYLLLKSTPKEEPSSEGTALTSIDSDGAERAEVDTPCVSWLLVTSATVYPRTRG